MRKTVLCALASTTVLLMSCSLVSSVTGRNTSESRAAALPLAAPSSDPKEVILYQGCNMMFYSLVYSAFEKGVGHYPRNKLVALRNATNTGCMEYYRNHPVCQSESYQYLSCLDSDASTECSEWMSIEKECDIQNKNTESECVGENKELVQTCIVSQQSRCEEAKIALNRCEENNQKRMMAYRLLTPDMRGSFDKELGRWNEQNAKTVTAEEKQEIERYCIEVFGKWVQETEDISETERKVLDTVVNKSCIKYMSDFPACRMPYMALNRCIYPSAQLEGEGPACESEYAKVNECKVDYYFEIEAYDDSGRLFNPKTVYRDSVWGVGQIKQTIDECVGFCK